MPQHRANNVVVNNADIEGPHEEMALKSTAWMK
jgi:hypothetical protein